MKKPARHPVRGRPFQSVDARRGPGGPRPGSGRPPEQLKVLCREIVDKLGLVRRLGKIAHGECIEPTVTQEGKKVLVPANTKTQVLATTELLDRGYGRPNQTIEINVNFAATLIAEVMKSLRLIPSSCPHCKTRLDVKESIGKHLLELSRKFEAGELVA